jgi:hypothetical protein
MTPLRDCLERLIQGEFICSYSQPELHRQMRNPEFADQVKDALRPFGRDLGILGDESSPDTFFARYESLDEPRDRAQLSADLVKLRDQIKPMLEFIRLFNQSGRRDGCLAPGEEISFANLLEAIEGHITYRDQLRDLAGHAFFKKISSGKDNKDRLGKALECLADAGYLIKQGLDSSNYLVTGKMNYIYLALDWLAQAYEIPLASTEGADSGSQGGLEV